MKPPFKCILLVDDDPASNFLHTRFLKKTGMVEEIKVVFNGLSALELLETHVSNHEPLPDLILLDLNMPVMTGWEFLTVFSTAPYLQDNKPPVYVLTSSLNPNDKAKANEERDVKGILEKMLTQDKFSQIVEEYNQ